jgi:hypothetical protein
MATRHHAVFSRPSTSLAHRTDEGDASRRIRQVSDHWQNVLVAFSDLRRARGKGYTCKRVSGVRSNW